MMRVLVLFIALMLSACSPRVIYKDRVETVSKPVTVACVSGERPVEPKAPKERYADWYDKSPKQQAELMMIYTLELYNYGKALDASTSACQ